MIHHVIFPDQVGATIRPEIYGNFSEHLGRCIYEGLYVGENSPIPNVNGIRTDAVEAMKAIRLPVLRWPGGCFADEYHWRDGIGPQEKRRNMVNTRISRTTSSNKAAKGISHRKNAIGHRKFTSSCRP